MNALVPASERRRTGLAVSTKVLATASSPQPRRISIKDQKFSLVFEDGRTVLVPTHHLDVIVMAVNPAKVHQYYDEAYTPGSDEFKPPVCFSWDGQKPDPAATKPQHPTCAGCKQAEWGSKINELTGGKRRACDEAYALAVLPLVEGVEIRQAFRLLIKGGSFKPFIAYAKELAHHDHPQYGRPFDMSDVVTRLTITQNVFGFKATAMPNEHLISIVDAILDSGEADQLTGVAPLERTAPQPPMALQAQPAPAVLQSPAQAAQSFAQEAQAAEEETQRRKRRTKAEMEAARAVEATLKPSPKPEVFPERVEPATDLPRFLRRDDAPPAAPAPTQGFGMAAPATPEPGLSAALSKAFNLPTMGK